MILLSNKSLSSFDSINLLKYLDSIAPFTCWIDSAVSTSTIAASNMFAIFVSKSKLIYLFFGRFFGLVDFSNVPDFFWYTEFPTEDKDELSQLNSLSSTKEVDLKETGM